MGFLEDLGIKKKKEEFDGPNEWETDGGVGSDGGWDDGIYGGVDDGPIAPSEPITPAPTTPAVALKIVTPKEYDDAKEITEFLMNGNTILINMDGVDRALAMRIIDYLKGAVQVLGGMITKASRTMLVVAPKNVDISSIEEMIGTAE